MQAKPLLITGASGYTGRRLTRRLLAGGSSLRLLLRSSSDVSWLEGIEPQPEIVFGDLEDEASVGGALRGVDRFIHLAHIRFSSVIVGAADPRIERGVFVSSLRALSRVPCPSVEEVLQGERDAASLSGSVILRPSMIYGPGDDRNLSRMRDWLRRRGWVPAIGATSLHQPVHVDDVVSVILAALDSRASGTFAIAGPAPMTYADLLHVLGRSVGVVPRIVPVPASPLILGLKVWRAFGLPAPVDEQQLQRLLEDKAYDIEPACQQLGFSPRCLAEGLADSSADPQAARL